MTSVQFPGGRILQTTPVFDTYWRFAHLRQEAFFKRIAGLTPPWTEDPIIANHRFTNVYRASDRVSQFLIREVLYQGSQEPREILFRTLLFKFFNRIDTWQGVVQKHGFPSYATFDLEAYDRTFDEMLHRRPIYNAAYIMPTPSLGASRKHSNHLRLLALLMKDGLADKIASAKSLQVVYELLRGYPSLGDFLAFQFAIDLNYSSFLHFSEDSFVVAGPGALRGIQKVFSDTKGLKPQEIIEGMTSVADQEFRRLGLPFQTLYGRKLHLIDIQNLFCETDKYARMAHPTIGADSGRSKIKQKFEAIVKPLPQFYPPKWGLKPPETSTRPSYSPIDALFDLLETQ